LRERRYIEEIVREAPTTLKKVKALKAETHLFKMQTLNHFCRKEIFLNLVNVKFKPFIIYFF